MVFFSDKLFFEIWDKRENYLWLKKFKYELF